MNRNEVDREELRLRETVTLTRRQLREIAEANWDAGYYAHRRGEQHHNPYRAEPQGAPPKFANFELVFCAFGATKAEAIDHARRQLEVLDTKRRHLCDFIEGREPDFCKGAPQKTKGET